MSAWAKPGVRCACISAAGHWSGPTGEAPAVPPLKGRIYTISEVEVLAGAAYLVLAECDADEMFSIKNFRPVVVHCQEHDLELFAHHLNSVEEPA